MAQLGTQQLGTNQLGADAAPEDIPVGSMSIAGFAPDIADVFVPVGTATLTGIAPQAPAIGYPAIEPPLGAGAITGLAPNAFIAVNVNPPPGSLSIVGFQPFYKERPEIPVPATSMAVTGLAGPTFRWRIVHRMPYNLRAAFTHRILYGIAEQLQAQHRIAYSLDAANPVQATHRISYGLRFHVEHRMTYTLQDRVNATHRMNYRLTNEVAPVHRVLYDLDLLNPVRLTHRMLYSIRETTIVNVTGATEILFGTRRVQVAEFRVFKDEDAAHWVANINLANIDDYVLFNQDDQFTLSIFGEEWELIVDSKELDRNEPGNYGASLAGVSPTARDDFPRADEYTRTFDTDITAQAAVTDALGIAVDWQIIDWTIPAYRLSAERASPLAFATRIVQAAGGVLESKKDGTWLARPLYPVSPTLYGVTTPDHTFAESDKILRASEQFVPGRTVNRIRISDGDANFNDVIEFEQDEDSELRGDLRVYPSPFRTTVTLDTTALPGDIQLTPYSPLEQTREVLEEGADELGELVEFVNCEGNLQYPVDAINEVVWVSEDLGAVTFETGSTTVRVNGPLGYGLARIKYNTRFLRYRAVATEAIDAQFILEDVG